MGILAGWPWGPESIAAESKGAVWIEGEDAVRHNFDPGPTVFVRPEDGGTSGGQYLRLHVASTPSVLARLPFYAEYEFEVPAAGEYRVWISGSEQDSAGIEPFLYRLDDGEFRHLKGRSWAGPKYGTSQPWAYFGWFLADTAVLKAGRHRIRLEVRQARASDSLFAGFIDALFLTTDKTFVPEGSRPSGSPRPPWAEVMRQMTFDQYVREVERNWYFRQIRLTREEVNERTAAEVRAKLMARALPHPRTRFEGPRRFGVQGMIWSFIEAGKRQEQTQAAYELLARAGVETFRTTDSLWCRVGENSDDFRELDFQVEHAARYGQSFMFMIGYPPAKYARSSGRYSAVRPEYEGKYREYLRALLNRYRDKAVIDYVELGNEVDAPEVWWLNSTPEMYVREMQIIHEEARKIDPKIKILAFGATYSRDERRSGANEGRAFVRRCFEVGIRRWVDGYSLHYTWSLDEKDFPAFFRRQMAAQGAEKPLINSEDTGQGEPYNIIKMFARNLFLYGFATVNYYLARDWCENGRLVSTGLFDIDFNPKLRLLAYALSVDAMKGRRLVGLAGPAKGVEAYVLEDTQERGGRCRYSVVMWCEGDFKDADGGSAERPRGSAIAVTGLSKVTSAWTWRLDRIAFDGKDPAFTLTGDEPIVIFADELPQWRLHSPAQWLDDHQTVKGEHGPALPNE